MRIIKNLGFSLICLDILNEVEKQFVFDSFRLFDVSISQIDLIPSNQILSVQSLFYGKNIKDCSLVNDEISFLNLTKLFSVILSKISAAKINSAIFGSPGLRKKFSKNSIDKNILYSRYNLLKNMARNANLDFYIEALSCQLCDFCNNHSELKELDEKMHIDFATMIVNGEDIYFLEKNLIDIKRFHISIPGYSYNFSEYPIIIEWTKLLLKNKIPGIIEIQNKLDNKDFTEEITCLIKAIEVNY